jgi:hypothetical protein
MAISTLNSILISPREELSNPNNLKLSHKFYQALKAPPLTKGLNANIYRTMMKPKPIPRLKEETKKEELDITVMIKMMMTMMKAMDIDKEFNAINNEVLI